MKRILFFPSPGCALALAAWAFTGAGCGTKPPRDLMMEEATAHPIERPVAMKGEATFLDGRLSAVATVSRGFERVGTAVRGGGKNRGDNDESGGRRRNRDNEGAFTETYSVSGDSEEEQKEAMAEYIRQAMARRAAGSPMPPVTLRVQFENHGKEPVEIEVTEVNSDLGNFAVRPSKLTIAPGEKGVLDPMISQLGVSSDEIPVRLAIRVAGKKEAQVVPVKNIIAASARQQFETMKK